MSKSHDDRPGGRSIRRLGRRRAGVAAGAVGLAAVLGAGVYLVSGRSDDGAGTPRDPAALTGLEPVPDASSAAVVSESPSSEPPATTTGPQAASPRPSGKRNVEQEIKTAREKAAKEGHPLQRALTAQGETAAQERTEKTSEGTVKVVTAKGDLTGQRELLLAADQGQPVGQARCTQRLKFANSAVSREMPTVLLCWRVSAKRSVVTFAVAKKGKPSAQASESIIDREWAKL